jgi:SulP family sulfate permease
VLEATGIVEIDFTAAQILSDTINACRADGVGFAIARLESDRAREAIEKFGIDELLETKRPFHSVEEAIRACRGEAGTETKPAAKAETRS